MTGGVASKKGITKLQKLYSDILVSGSLTLDVGTYNTTLSGSNGGLLQVQVDYPFANKPTFGTSVFNANVNKKTGGTWDIWNLQTEQQSVPNSRGQTWGNSEWIQTLFNYEAYLKSGVLSGRELTLTVGEGVGNVVIHGMPLDQRVASSNEFFSFVKTGGGAANSNLAISETFTMEYGNIFLNSKNGQTLKNRGSLLFTYDTFLELVGAPDTFLNSQHKCLVSKAANLDFRLALQSNDTSHTINIGESLNTFDRQANTLIVGHSAGNQATDSVTNNNNVIFGNKCMKNADGSNNTCIGENIFCSGGQKVSLCNTGVGVGCLEGAITDSNYNVAIGTNAGKQANSSFSVWVGSNSGLGSALQNQLTLGSLITGKMTNSDMTSQISINADTINMGGLAQKNDQLDKLANQVWVDIEAGNILKIGNVTTGTSHDIIGGNIDYNGQIHLVTRKGQIPNVICTGDLFTGSVVSGCITEFDNKIHLSRVGQSNVEIENILHSNYLPSSLIIDHSGNVVVATAGHNTANILLQNNVYTRDVANANAIDNRITLTKNNQDLVVISNVVTLDNTITGGVIDETNAKIIINRFDGSNISFFANFTKGFVTGGALATDSNLSLSRHSDNNLIIPNVLHRDYTITSNSVILQDGAINFVTKGANAANVVFLGDVYKGTVQGCSVSGNNLILSTKNSGNIEINNIVEENTHIVGSTITNDGNVLLTTQGGGTIKLFTLKNRVSGGSFSGNLLTIEKYDAPSIYVTGLGGISGSASATTQSNLVKIPMLYKTDHFNTGYRASRINMTRNSLFSSFSTPSILHGPLTTQTNYGTYQGYVAFEFYPNSVETDGLYAINEVELVLTASETFANSGYYNGFISIKGSTNNSTWYSLNTPHGYIYDIWNRKTIESRVCVTLRLTNNINNYKYYKIEFEGFGTASLPQIACVNFDYNIVHEEDYTTKLWVPPSRIGAVVPLTSLPSPIILVANQTCRIQFVFYGGDEFSSSDYATFISSIEFSTDGESSYTSVVLSTANVAMHAINKTISFDFASTTTNEHVFRVKLIGTPYYKASIPQTSIWSFPSILSTVKLAPHDTNDITVGQPISMESTFSTDLHQNLTGSISVVDSTGGVPTVSSESITNAKYQYSFTVENDADHSATITLTFSGFTYTYSWSAAGLLTAANDIYTFPDGVSYDGSTNGYGSGIHLKESTASTLILSFTGGDQLHSDTYASQVSSITYKTGSAGPLATVPSSDVAINSATGYETITVGNIIATAVDDIYVNITLKGPDAVVMASALVATVPSSAVKSNLVEPHASCVLQLSMLYDGYYTTSSNTVTSITPKNPFNSSAHLTLDQNLYPGSTWVVSYPEFGTTSSGFKYLKFTKYLPNEVNKLFQNHVATHGSALAISSTPSGAPLCYTIIEALKWDTSKWKYKNSASNRGTLPIPYGMWSEANHTIRYHGGYGIADHHPIQLGREWHNNGDVKIWEINSTGGPTYSATGSNSHMYTYGDVDTPVIIMYRFPNTTKGMINYINTLGSQYPWDASDRNWAGDIYEIRGYNAILTDTEIDAEIAAMRSTWGGVV